MQYQDASDWNPTFGEFLESVLKRKRSFSDDRGKYTTEWLARTSGLSIETIQSVINNKAELTAEITDKIGEAMAEPTYPDTTIKIPKALMRQIALKDVELSVHGKSVDFIAEHFHDRKSRGALEISVPNRKANVSVTAANIEFSQNFYRRYAEAAESNPERRIFSAAHRNTQQPIRKSKLAEFFGRLGF